MINLIVTIATLLGAAVVGVWIVYPAFRSSIEAPKFRLLETEERFDSNNFNPVPPEPSSTPRNSLEPSGDGTSTQHDTRQREHVLKKYKEMK